MQVTISVGGRFHAFYLAQQLLKYGYLQRLITSYPKFEVLKYGIPRDRVGSVLIKELMLRGWQKVPFNLRELYNPQYLIHEIYDRWASYLYDGKSDICVAFSSFGLHTIRKAKDGGAVTIVERGSSHMLYQQKILKEEYEKFRLRPNLSHCKIVKKELQEYEEADYISIPSLFAKRTFLEEGVLEEKLIHVPYGVHLDEFMQIPKEDNIFRVVYAGNIGLWKGVHYLLQAYSELRLPSSELLLVGAIIEDIKPFMRMYEGNYRWVGHVPQKHLYKYYCQSSVFVMMSLPMVIPQAMACGLPVICTASTGGEDIVRDGVDGFIIPIRHVEALKQSLLYLYENADVCRAMGQSAKERVSKRFTWDDYGERIIQQYERILNEKN
jgi:glycosyltransferase involved in cell wall biosynthesis